MPPSPLVTKHLLPTPGGGSAPTASSLPTSAPASECFGRAVRGDGNFSENTAECSHFSLRNRKYSPCKPLEKGSLKLTADGKQESLIVAVQVHPQTIGGKKGKASPPPSALGRGPLDVGFPFLPPNTSPGHAAGEPRCHAWVLRPSQGEKREGSPKDLLFPSRREGVKRTSRLRIAAGTLSASHCLSGETACEGFARKSY